MRTVIYPIVMTLAAVIWSCGASRNTAVHDVPMDESHECTLTETSRDVLRLTDGRLVYIEPEAFVSNGSEVLLAGYPNAVTTLDRDDVVELVKDGIIGVLISGDSVFPIPTPARANAITSVRAAASARGSWHVLFTDSTGTDAVHSRVWVGEHDGRKWLHLDTVPLPEGVIPWAEFGSSLVTRGDSVMWAAPVQLGQGVVVMSRMNGSWEHDVISTFGVTTELAHVHAKPRLLVVQADPELRGDRNSLLQWEQRPEWTRSGRIVRGSDEGPVYGPRYTALSDGAVTTWFTSSEGRTEVRARWLTDAGEHRSTVVIDSAVRAFGNDYRPVLMADGNLVWVVDHEEVEGSPLLRVVAMRNMSPAGTLAFTDPYIGFTAAVGRSDGGVLITGLHQARNNGPIASLQVSVHVECRS